MGVQSRTLFHVIPGRLILLAVLAAAAAALALGGWPAPGSATTTPIFRPRPLLSDHLAKRQLGFAPTTADCLRLIGVKCYQPFQFQKVYNLAPLYKDGFNGAGRTIVIVDSFGSPTIKDDLKVFDKAFNLPDPPAFDVISPAGPSPKFDPNDGTMFGWALETTLDVEMAHTIAPGAKLLLVTTPIAETEGVQGFPEMMLSENFVIDHNMGDVISQSFGATEPTFPNKDSLLDLRSAFKNAAEHHVTVLASSGDDGATGAMLDGTCCFPFRAVGWPASDPLVTAVGGTLLDLDANGNRVSPDVTANDGPGGIASGSGLSSVFSRPGFQDDVRSVVGGRRGIPDISMSASCNGLALVFASFDGTNSYFVVCGTSESSPLFAGIVAIADQMAHRRLGLINDRIYALLGDRDENRSNGLIDITKGNTNWTFCVSACGAPTEVDKTVVGFPATRGYDLATGVGTIDANAFVRRLVQGSQGDNGGGGGNNGGGN